MGEAKDRGVPPEQEDEIKLGARYKDTLHGKDSIEGVAVGITKWLTGCNRVCLEYIKEGEIKEVWFDMNRVKRVPEAPVVEKPAGKDPGGPRPTAPRRDPSR